MGINLKGIRYRIQRCFGLTDYDREQRKKRQKTDLSFSEGLIESLNIAPLSDLPIGLSAQVAYVVYFILACAFGFFVFQGFSTARQEKFLALSSSAGVCETVPKIVSGVYNFDIYGNWEGSEDFAVSESIYSLTLNRLQYTNEEFADLAELAMSQLNRIGHRSHNITLDLNLVNWMSWSINTVASANRQHFRLTGDAKTLYNQGTMHLPGMSSQQLGRCNASSSITFEKASGIYRLRYSYEEFSKNEACMRVADPRNLNYAPNLGNDDFILEFDVQSVMTVLGVNYDIVDYEVLQEVPHSKGVLVIDGKVQEYAQYYNPRYPDMNPITCFPQMNTSNPEYQWDRVDTCSIEVGLTPMYPVFNHRGYAPYSGSMERLYCSCAEELISNDDLSSQCHDFILMTGFLFYNTDYDESRVSEVPPQLEKLKKLIVGRYPGPDRKLDLNRDAYNISKDAFHFTEDNYYSSAERQSFYDFCIVDGTPCSIIAIYTEDGTGRHHGLSPDYYQVQYGHCNDTVTVSEESQQKLTVPPVPLTENYLECRRTLFAAVLASGGIAVGNVLSVKSALVLFFAFFLARYTAKPSTSSTTGGQAQKVSKVRARYTTYGLVERDKVLQYLAFNLLLARDGKYQDYDAEARRNPSGLLVQNLAKELETHPSIKRFFLADDAEVAENGQDNPLHQHASESGIELKTASSRGTNAGGGSVSSDSNDKKSGLCSSLTASISRRNDKVFQEEMLPNPMSVNEKDTS